MNSTTRQIAQLLNISKEEAYKVQDYIENKAMLDFSECSQRRFNAVVKSVFVQLSK
jgi:hypothetical protein